MQGVDKGRAGERTKPRGGTHTLSNPTKRKSTRGIDACGRVRKGIEKKESGTNGWVN